MSLVRRGDLSWIDNDFLLSYKARSISHSCTVRAVQSVQHYSNWKMKFKVRKVETKKEEVKKPPPAVKNNRGNFARSRSKYRGAS